MNNILGDSVRTFLRPKNIREKQSGNDFPTLCIAGHGPIYLLIPKCCCNVWGLADLARRFDARLGIYRQDQTEITGEKHRRRFLLSVKQQMVLRIGDHFIWLPYCSWAHRGSLKLSSSPRSLAPSIPLIPWTPCSCVSWVPPFCTVGEPWFCPHSLLLSV